MGAAPCRDQPQNFTSKQSSEGDGGIGTGTEAAATVVPKLEAG